MALTVRVLCPGATVYDAPAAEVILPSTTGQLGILPGHAPLLSALDTGVMRVKVDKDWQNIALMGGFAEVDNDEVTVLVNGAERGSDIDVDEARSSYEAAQAEAAKAGAEPAEQLQAAQNVRRARARLQAAGGAA
jgi:F-type H+-transporting ATPase subunit epsilon